MRFGASPGSLTTAPALILLVIGLFGLAFTACGGGEPTSPASGSNGEVGLASLQGKIAIDGSSTVFPITEAIAEEFGILTRRNVRITVAAGGEPFTTLFGLRYEHPLRASIMSFQPHAKTHSPVLAAIAAGKCRVGYHQKTFQHRARFIERLPFALFPQVPVLTPLILGLEFPERVV